MNERLKKLAEHCGLPTDQDRTLTHEVEKFAELIVAECAVYCEGHILPKRMAEENGLNYNDGVRDCAIGLKNTFGVEQ